MRRKKEDDMAAKISGNFAFLHDINPGLYSMAYDMESKSRTDFRAAGHLCREIMEQLAAYQIQKYDLASYIPRSRELNSEHLPMSRIALGRKYKVLQDKNLCIQSEKGITDALFPNLGSITYEMAGGDTCTTDSYEFLRRLGNTCSHSSGQNSADIRLNYSAIKNGIRFVHMTAKYVFQSNSRSAGSFDENKMPVLNYSITRSYVPDDSERSSCIREFEAECSEGDGRKTKYAILRMYDKNSAKRAFMLRNQTCFSEASSVSIDSVPEGMALLMELTPLQSQSSNFYIIAYLFNKKPYTLEEKLPEIKDYKTKIRMCRRLANSIYSLHSSEIPICCRLLNYESIFVCEFREWVPYIIKFDYSKIIDKEAPAATVYKNAKSAGQEVKTQRKLAKYIPYEWDQLDQNADIEQWKKVDVYSLGVLMADILNGKITEQMTDLEDLYQKGADENTLELIDLMLSEDPEMRPDIEEVKNYFDQVA